MSVDLPVNAGRVYYHACPHDERREIHHVCNGVLDQLSDKGGPPPLLPRASLMLHVTTCTICTEFYEEMQMLQDVTNVTFFFGYINHL